MLEFNNIYQGNSFELLKEIDDNSIDSIVTDPPYGLENATVGWDTFKIPKGGSRIKTDWKDFGSKEHARNATEAAKVSRRKNIAYYNHMLGWLEETFRVLKPGGYILVFSSSRTYHRLTCAIEDSGFEIRDQLQWLYATGFPKSKTSLKPAYEPIVLARKPPSENSIKRNVEKYGTGELNIDDCRIGEEEKYPSNIIIDDNVGDILKQINEKLQSFFYTPKPSKKEKGEFNTHPTVKPIMLMEYLVRLVTPENGTCLDPFAGSGSTLLACINMQMKYIGFELNQEYIDIFNKRIHNII
jgi:site-specific DNA-methyltransferase (adenine-specific)